jgi:hypothetical protein
MRKQLDVDLTEVIAQARAEERAAVVAWLRANREASPLPKTCWEADAIERGEHRREENA